MTPIMCVDVGIANIGVAVIDPHTTVHGHHVALAMYHFRTEKSDATVRWRHADDRARRVGEAARFYQKVIADHGIKRGMAELPSGGAPNSAAATDLAMASAALVAVWEVNDVAAEWYSPNEVKRAVVGRNTATKDEMMDAIALIYPAVLLQFPAKARREHVCDALGVWLAGRNGALARL